MLAETVAAEVAYHCEDRPELAVKAKEKVVEWTKDMQEGDVIYEFRSDQASWASLAGRAGYVIMRNDQAISVYVTRMS